METHVLRLKPGEDLKRSLDAFVQTQRWPAACIVTAVGSLSRTAVRSAGAKEIAMVDGPFEIVSLSGTLGNDSGSHLALSDGTGRMLGGHLKEGALVHTTAEVVLARLDGWHFSRPVDPSTGYPELRPERER